MSDKSICQATCESMKKAAADGVKTAFERADEMKPCPIGASGSCCKICAMGPCRITGKDVENKRSVCGADIDTIAARNFARMIAAGTSAHSDHGRAVAHAFIGAAKGKLPGYQIKDKDKLMQVAQDLGVDTKNKDVAKIAEQVGEICLNDFGNQEGEIKFIKRAPAKRQEIWRKLGVVPRGIDREVIEMMHRTHMGVDMDYKNIMLQGTRCALADGWGGSMIATELQDIMFGTPIPLRSKVNLGVLQKDQVNIVVHGHEPLLSEIIVMVSQDKEMLKLARAKGAKGINLAGICCTSNEILMRHGIPIAGNFLQQELAIVTGAVDAMVVDVQCIMQSLPHVAECYHTKLITTTSKAKIANAVHIEFKEDDAINTAKQIIKTAIENYPNRKKVDIPKHEMDLIAGFNHETINYMLGGSFRASYRPLNDNIINGRIRGIAGVVGCNNPRVKHDYVHVELVKELIANDVLVVQTGCSAIACAKAGLLVPEAASQAGKGLAEVCATVGMPPVLHCGSCVDNSRILVATTEMVREGGLGDDISQLPVVGAAPEWMSEKAIAIGQYFVASGVYTVFGVNFPSLGSKNLTDHLFKGMEKLYGGMWNFEADPNKMAGLMIDRINKARDNLGISKAKERVLYDMEARRSLEV